MSRLSNFIAAPIGVALAIILLVFHPAAADGPRAIKNAVMQIITDDDGKDDTDVLTVTVKNAAGAKLLERVFDAKEEIKPFTTFTLWLQKVAGAPAEPLAGDTITFHVDTKWDEHWVVKEARLTVNYETGPPDKWHWGPLVLQRKGAGPFELQFTLSDDRKF